MRRKIFSHTPVRPFLKLSFLIKLLFDISALEAAKKCRWKLGPTSSFIIPQLHSCSILLAGPPLAYSHFNERIQNLTSQSLFGQSQKGLLIVLLPNFLIPQKILKAYSGVGVIAQAKSDRARC